MKEQLKAIMQATGHKIAQAGDMNALNDIRVAVLGRKGELTGLLRGLKDLPAELKAEMGKVANEVKGVIEGELEARAFQIREQDLQNRLAREKIDVSLPGHPFKAGGKHPLTRTLDDIKAIFIGMGFSVAEGPEIESDYYCFEALNVSKDHPARDMQDTFYITEDVVLRTHTSPVQIREMEKHVPKIPLKIIIPGKVYRKDDDATHSPMFSQVEGLLIGDNIRFSDLKGVLMDFARHLFGSELQVRYRPSYFPFTEPSAEMDISCVACGGSGCRVCGHTGWLEILGAGMVHPNVLINGGYDPEKVAGFAFGMGIERISMLKYGINDLRLFFDNDLRFLAQF